MLRRLGHELLRFKADEGAGGEAGDAAQGDAGSQSTDQGDAGGQQTRTFTQDDVDRIVKDRLLRAKATPPDDYEELKAAKAELDKIKEESQSELERAQTRAAELEREREQAVAERQEALLRSAVVAEAARKNVVDPDAAVALIDRASLEFGDDGSPTNIADAMDSLLKAKPYLVAGGRPGGSADLGARGGDAGKAQIDREQLKTMTPEQIVDARKEGRLDAALKGA